MATFTLTEEQARRPSSFALGKLLGQKSDGSGDDFSITTTADRDDDGNFLGTYTLEIPDGRATKAQVMAVLDDPKPEQPPIVPRRIDELRGFIRDGSANLDNVIEYIKLRDGI